MKLLMYLLCLDASSGSASKHTIISYLLQMNVNIAILWRQNWWNASPFIEISLSYYCDTLEECDIKTDDPSSTLIGISLSYYECAVQVVSNEDISSCGYNVLFHNAIIVSYWLGNLPSTVPNNPTFYIIFNDTVVVIDVGKDEIPLQFGLYFLCSFLSSFLILAMDTFLPSLLRRKNHQDSMMTKINYDDCCVCLQNHFIVLCFFSIYNKYISLIFFGSPNLLQLQRCFCYCSMSYSSFL